MNPEKQRIAIAEACGWKRVNSVRGSLLPMEFRVDSIGEVWTCLETRIPDYLNDLNAMHEAEKELYARPNKSDGTVWAYVYESHLINITTTEIIATAAQRAEAFLKTIGKWDK